MNFPNNGRIISSVFKTYKSLHNNLRVPIKFVIPKSPEWPEQYYGYKLGRYVDKIRQCAKKTSKKYKYDENDIHDLVSEGFVIDAIADKENRVLEAFSVYKEKKGTCEVDDCFRIGKKDYEWPEFMRGFNLGGILHDIRNKNSFTRIQPAVAKLGFDIQPPWTINNLRTALNVYTSINGHVQVPSDYCIPRDDNRYPDYLRGKHLGAAVHSAQKYGCYEEHHNELKEMGVNFKILAAFHVEFEVIYDASNAYRKIHGNMDVPHNFIVPYGLNIYPKHTWGLELGYALVLIRTKSLHFEQHQDKLISLGLNLNVRSKRDFETVYSALETYKLIHGNLNIPRKFVVPSEDDRYPREMWGMKLGRYLHSIRGHNAYFEHREQLVKLGVNFEVKAVHTHEFDDIFSALVSYKTVNGDLLVSNSFIIPHNDSNYRTETWGMNLGNIVNHIRNNDTYSEYKERLTELGFVYDTVKDVQFECIYTALLVYKSIHGNVIVPQSFVVPHNDSNYPSETWGIKLGNIVNTIRNNDTHSQYKERLTEMGFVYDAVKDVRFEHIYSALVAYKSIHGNVLVPSNFVVPADDLNYPINIWKLNLGFVVQNIRHHDYYSEYHSKLEALGIKYSAKVKAKREEEAKQPIVEVD